MDVNKILNCDWIEGLRSIPDNSINCCVTSPPYWGLRDYGVEGQLGLEKTPELYVEKIVAGFREVKRVLRNDGTLWLNLGDSYWGGKGQSAQAWSTEHQNRNTINKSQHQISGKKETRPQDGKHEVIKSKDLVGIPWMVAFALRADGWYLRQDIIWHKPNPMPESVTDRCTKSHEYIFLLSKSSKYYYDSESIRTPISLWSILRYDQNLENKTGSDRVPGKTNGNMKPSWKGSSFDTGKTGEMKQTRGHRKSGNIERKTGSERGCPENTGSNVCGSVPWEGSMANKKSVWTVSTKPFNSDVQTYHWVPVESCVPFGDTMHIMSLNCPVHGYLNRSDSNAFYGEHVADELARILHTDIHHAQELISCYASIDQIFLEGFGLQNLDYSQRWYLISAIPHNNESHKMDHAPETNSPCISFSQIASRIGDKLELHETSGLVGRMLLSNISPDDLDDRLSDQILFRNGDMFSYSNIECTCQRYKKETKKTSHFATFPPELIVDCIKAGCPEGGIVLDPFMGAGTTALVSRKLNRNYIGIELNDKYIAISEKRLHAELGLFQ